jgi:amidophosphoribosyltransferase
VIGADAVIYQNLEDLKDACASLSPRPNQKFEVGVFCGKYITPVQEGYFEHLDQLRGTRKKEAEIDSARQAIVAGVADGSAVKAALAAAAASKINPRASQEVAQLSALVNGTSINTNVATTNGGSHHEEQEDPSPRRAQDISLHNFNDHEDS